MANLTDVDKITHLKYNELQKLAKSFGIKANMKCEKLRQALKKFTQDQLSEDEGNNTDDSEPGLSEEDMDVSQYMSEDDEIVVNANSSALELPNLKTPKLLKQKNKLFPTPKASPTVISPSPARAVKKTVQQRAITPKSATPQSPKKATPAGKTETPERRRSGRKSASPVVKEMLAAMKEDMTDEELKSSLLSTLEKSVSKKMELGSDAEKRTGIPRFAAFALAKKAELNKKASQTPGDRFKTSHAKAFNNMDSLDVYMDKKRQREEAVQTSVKKAKLAAEKTRSAIDSLQKCRTPPVKLNKTAASRAALFKSPCMGVPFVPKVTAIASIKTNFSSLKTPAASETKPLPMMPSSAAKENKSTAANRKSMGSNLRKSPAVKKAEARKSFGANLNKTYDASNLNKTSGDLNKTTSSATTPFKFGGNTTIVEGSSKKTFNLAASLSKPVTWKTHKGKLPSFGDKRQDPKEVTVKGRDDRRMASKANQSSSRHAVQMKKRGIV